VRPRSRVSGEIRRILKVSERTCAADGHEQPKRNSRAAHVPVSRAEAERLFRAWFSSRGWQPFAFQETVWKAYVSGRSGLISVPTGSGKTYAAIGGPLIELLSTPAPSALESQLAVLYISPLKALVRDVASAIRRPLEELALPFDVDVRTGDTSSTERARIKNRMPHVLVTTPESLALILTDREWKKRIANLQAIVLDEWHELLGTKRGSLLELTLARVRQERPEVRTWALSATVANLEQAAHAAIGDGAPLIVKENLERPVSIRSLLPPTTEAFPWFGHSGLKMAKLVADDIDPKKSTLIFTNTRSHAERWFAELASLKPEWGASLALHHGSLDREERERVEDGVKDGSLKVVVATSSLDLGVDFPQVEKVIQIGSAKGLARALQRAGRAFHRPGEATELAILPTHLLEIVEISALRRGLDAGLLEARVPLDQPLDVFVQFLQNCAFGEGFTRAEALHAARATVGFRHLSELDLDWALSFLVKGGYSLQAYPQFQKLFEQDARFRFVSSRHERMHRMNIGTILGSEGLLVRFLRGAKLGVIDEGFITRLKPGSAFQFAGRTLKLVNIRDMNAYVRLSNARELSAPVWNGTLLPISPVLSGLMQKEIARLAVGASDSPELVAFEPAARLQRARSAIPQKGELLIECMKSRDGYHLFLYPWAGRLVHEGLGHLLAFRLSRGSKNTISVSVNDHGLELLATKDLGGEAALRGALTLDGIDDDIDQSMNFPELSKRAFREVARVAGLIQQSVRGSQRKEVRQVQVSSGILFDVLNRYEPEHPLVLQAEREVRDRQLQLERLTSLLHEISGQRMLYQEIERLTPFAFPLYLERVRSNLSTEKLEDRVERILRQATKSGEQE
jgi:ATP-dependent Lhr-like helicase